MTRRAARNLSLPEDETAYLRSLSTDQDALDTRLALLYQAGWTLRALGEALDPPRSRSTMQSWVTRGTNPETPANPPTLPVETPPEPAPTGYVSRRPVSPGIPHELVKEISHIAPLARRYRSQLHPNHQISQANLRLSTICAELHAQGVPVQELADTANVTYRAMSQRLTKHAALTDPNPES